MLEAHALTKRYGGTLAVDKVSFRVNRGEIVGYLGPNGSGKSTTVNIVVGLLEPTSGSVTLDGQTLLEDQAGYQKKPGRCYGRGAGFAAPRSTPTSDHRAEPPGPSRRKMNVDGVVQPVCCTCDAVTLTPTNGPRIASSGARAVGLETIIGSPTAVR